MIPAPVPKRGRPRDAGFTLIEVIVALAILATAVVASIQGFAGGLRLLKLSGDHQHAILLADQKIREATKLEEGREEGTEDAFTWERTTQAVPAPELETTTSSAIPGVVPGVSPVAATIVTEPKWRVYRIEVKVKWEKRSVELATLRTEPVQKPGTTTTGAPGTSTSPAGAPTSPATAPNPRATPRP